MLIPTNNGTPKTPWPQFLAVLVVLAALLVAVLLELRGAELAGVLAGTLTVAGILARKR